ncbi:hypothetical protein HU200_063668 [Digitaria exilis]|uniref:DUF1618 domain-containing protein n=1 Tax=Digitaria exilis TaxID=1010633 RepID=A0A835A120_9POAL|nr:hypothetical protein HU200_063668 [Digitaria exilis]
MASACFILDRDVRLVASTGEKTSGGRRMSSFLTPWKITTEENAMSFADRVKFLESCGYESDGEDKQNPNGLADWVREGTIKVVADNLVDPPEISTLSLHLPAIPADIVGEVEEVNVTSSDEGLLVLSTGPASFRLASSGCYLVYDAIAGDLFLAPPTDTFEFKEVFGCRPVIVRRGGSTLCYGGRRLRPLREVIIIMMTNVSNNNNDEQRQQQWVWSDVCLPDDMAHYPFRADVAFAFQGRLACWVDLYLGILTCDLLPPEPPRFELKLLPEDYVVRRRRGRPDGYSTASCVHGRIKFLYMEGFMDEEVPRDKVPEISGLMSRLLGFRDCRSACLLSLFLASRSQMWPTSS